MDKAPMSFETLFKETLKEEQTDLDVVAERNLVALQIDARTVVAPRGYEAEDDFKSKIWEHYKSVYGDEAISKFNKIKDTSGFEEKFQNVSRIMSGAIDKNWSSYNEFLNKSNISKLADTKMLADSMAKYAVRSYVLNAGEFEDVTKHTFWQMTWIWPWCTDVPPE